jgi:sugar phosphate isomerase/epimerase
MYTRRDLGKLALATLPTISALGKISSKIHGVQMGVCGFSYNTLPRQGLLDVIVNSMVDSGIGDVLLFAPSTEPVELADKARPARGGGGGGAARGGSGGQGRGASGGQGRAGGGGRGPVSPEQAAAVEALHQWHLTVSLDYYTAIRKKFADAGLEINSFDASLGATTSDEDINKACEVTKTLGAHFMMCAVPRSVAKRIAPLAEKHGIKVAFQGRPNINSTDPDIMAKPADFEEAMGYSKNFGTCIDVGDATGGGWDALKFIQDTHPRVFALNMKDRTKANVSMPWGQGDTHVKEILQLVRDKKYPVRCYIDCEYALPEGSTRVAEIKRCMEFAKAALT